MSALQDLYQEVIVDHNKSPRNFHKMDNASHHAEGYNPLCGDHFTVYMLVTENNVITDISFTGHGCAISTASASLMTDALKGKTLDVAEKLFNDFHDLIATEKSVEMSKLGKLTVLAGVKEFPARVKCATLAWHALHGAMHNETEPAKTE